MTEADAIELVKIIQWADGGCSHCTSSLMNSVAQSWPQIEWRKLYTEHAVDGGSWYENEPG